MAPSHQYALQVVYTPTPFRLLSLRLFILPPIILGERLLASAELAGENGVKLDYSLFLHMADYGIGTSPSHVRSGRRIPSFFIKLLRGKDILVIHGVLSMWPKYPEIGRTFSHVGP